MITLDNFENFVPYKILMRGEEYYDTDAVSELEETSPGEWTAHDFLKIILVTKNHHFLLRSLAR